MSPTLRSGKICYVEIPALDVNQSAAFYAAVVGWKTRQRAMEPSPLTTALVR